MSSNEPRRFRQYWSKGPGRSSKLYVCGSTEITTKPCELALMTVAPNGSSMIDMNLPNPMTLPIRIVTFRRPTTTRSASRSFRMKFPSGAQEANFDDTKGSVRGTGPSGVECVPFMDFRSNGWVRLTASWPRVAKVDLTRAIDERTKRSAMPKYTMTFLGGPRTSAIIQRPLPAKANMTPGHVTSIAWSSLTNGAIV